MVIPTGSSNLISSCNYAMELRQFEIAVLINHLALWAGKEAVSSEVLPSAFPGLVSESFFIVFESEETDRLRK